MNCKLGNKTGAWTKMEHFKLKETIGRSNPFERTEVAGTVVFLVLLHFTTKPRSFIVLQTTGSPVNLHPPNVSFSLCLLASLPENPNAKNSFSALRKVHYASSSNFLNSHILIPQDPKSPILLSD